MNIDEINAQIEAEKQKLNAAPSSQHKFIQARIDELETQKKEVQKQMIAENEAKTNATEQQKAIAQAQVEAKKVVEPKKGTGLAAYDTYEDARKALSEHGYAPSREAWENARRNQGLDVPQLEPELENSINPIDWMNAGKSYEEYASNAAKSTLTGSGRSLMSRDDWDKLSARSTPAAADVIPTSTRSGSGSGSGVENMEDDEQMASSPATESREDTMTRNAVQTAERNARQTVDDNNLIDAEKVDLETLRNLYNDISDYSVEGMPSTIWQAYKQGLLGEVGSEDAETARKQLILNQIFNTIGNAGAAWQGKEGTQSLWETKTAKDWEEASNRKNAKLRTQMEQQLNLAGLAAEDQEKARKAINELSTNAYFARAMQQINNIEGVLGLYEIQKTLGNDFAKLDKNTKQNLMIAYGLTANGEIDAAQTYLAGLSRKEQENIGKVAIQLDQAQQRANISATNAGAAVSSKTAEKLGKDIDWYDAKAGAGMVTDTLKSLSPLAGIGG